MVDTVILSGVLIGIIVCCAAKCSHYIRLVERRGELIADHIIQRENKT